MIRKFFAVNFVITLVTLIIPASLLLHITRTYLNPDFYEVNSKTLIQPAITENISSQLIKQNPEIEKFLVKEEITEELNLLFSENWIKKTSKDIFSQIENFKKGDKITISLKQIKSGMPELTEKISLKIVKKLPVCTAKETLKYQIQQDTIPDCIPKTVDQSELAKEISKNINQSNLEYIPNEITIGESENEFIITFFQKTIVYRDYIQIAIIGIFVLFLFSIAVLINHPITSILNWESVTLFLCTLVLLLEIIAFQKTDIIFKKLHIGVSSDIMNLINKEITLITNQFIVIGEILTAMALLCIVSSIFISIKRKYGEN